MKNERAWPDSAVGSHPGNSIHRARYCVQSYRRTASRRSFSVRLAILVAHLARRPILRSWSVFSFPDACFFLSPVPSISVSQLGFPHRGDSDFSHFPWIPISCLRPSIFEGLISFLQLCFLLLRRFIFFFVSHQCFPLSFSAFICFVFGWRFVQVALFLVYYRTLSAFYLDSHRVPILFCVRIASQLICAVILILISFQFIFCTKCISNQMCS